MLLQTKKEQDLYHIVILRELIKKAGSATHLARMLGVTVSVVNSWVFNQRISKNGARLVEEHPVLSLDFTADMLRRDL